MWMRIALAAVFSLAIPAYGSIQQSFQASITCAHMNPVPDPRWILLTVLQTEFMGSSVDPPPARKRVLAVDRCLIGSIWHSDTGSPEGSSSTVTIMDPESGDITMSWYVKESVQDICQAVNDCVDATAGTAS